MKKNGDYTLSILKSADGDPASCRRYFFAYEAPRAGQGHFIHTYMGDGTPLPSFVGEPEQVEIPCGTPAELADLLWDSLNAENKVSLFVRYIDRKTGDWETVIKTSMHQPDGRPQAASDTHSPRAARGRRSLDGGLSQ